MTLHLDREKASYNVKVKLPKLLLGPLEFGGRVAYAVAGDELLDKATAEKADVLDKQRFKPEIVVKESLFRGKLMLDVQERTLTYSKKLRLPWLNTELIRLEATAGLPHAAPSEPAGAAVADPDTALVPKAGGAGGARQILGFRITCGGQVHRKYKETIVRKHPQYKIRVRPNIGLPQGVWSAIHFPGAVYAQVAADVNAQVTDWGKLRSSPPTIHVDVQEVNVVWRMYNVNELKPSLAFRSLLPPPLRKGRKSSTAAETAAVGEPEATAPVPAAGSGASSSLVSVSSPIVLEDLLTVAKHKVEQWGAYLADTHRKASTSLAHQLKAAVSDAKAAQKKK